MVTLVNKHMLRLLKTAFSLQMLDATTIAIQVSIPNNYCHPRERARLA